MHGPTRIFWANLKPFSLQCVRVGYEGKVSRLVRDGGYFAPMERALQSLAAGTKAALFTTLHKAASRGR